MSSVPLERNKSIFFTLPKRDALLLISENMHIYRRELPIPQCNIIALDKDVVLVIGPLEIIPK